MYRGIDPFDMEDESIDPDAGEPDELETSGRIGDFMDIMEVSERPSFLIAQLVEVWERSVKATHLFLSDCERETIKQFVPQALKEIPHLVVAQKGGKVLVAFMGVEAQRLEMLFLSPEERGRGLGRQLLEYGIRQFSIRELTVNEQNPLAKGFYEHMGFQVYKRTECDEQGNPYPLLYMTLNNGTFG